MDRPHLWKPSGHDCWIFIAHCWCNVGGEFRWSWNPHGLRSYEQLSSNHANCFFLVHFYLFIKCWWQKKKKREIIVPMCPVPMIFYSYYKSRANCHERLKYWIRSSQTVEIMCLRWVRYSQYWAHVVPWKKKKNNIGDATLKHLSFLLAMKFIKCAENTCALLGPRFKIFNAAAFRN